MHTGNDSSGATSHGCGSTQPTKTKNTNRNFVSDPTVLLPLRGYSLFVIVKYISYPYKPSFLFWYICRCALRRKIYTSRCTCEMKILQVEIHLHAHIFDKFFMYWSDSTLLHGVLVKGGTLLEQYALFLSFFSEVMHKKCTPPNLRSVQGSSVRIDYFILWFSYSMGAQAQARICSPWISSLWLWSHRWLALSNKKLGE
jgi:hypothetical protein